MSDDTKNIQLTHHESDVDFNIYYEMNLAVPVITGIYISGNQVDLIDIVSDEVKEDLEQDITDSFE